MKHNQTMSIACSRFEKYCQTSKRFSLLILFLFLALLIVPQAKAQNPTITFASGSYIIDMGQANQTFANGLKPYGLVYDLILNHSVPVSWSINSSKVKDGTDFTVNGKDYKGGPFIIASEYITSDVLRTIVDWQTQGVIVDQINESFSAPIFHTLSSWPYAVLDETSGYIVKAFYENAGIPSTSYITAGNPTSISSCEDIYVLPHADPDNWSQAYIDALKKFIEVDKGYLWSGCRAVSQLENLANCNFLNSDSLIKWDEHADFDENIPYDYAYSTEPIMQFMGGLDEATNKGTERIYIPWNSWRTSTKVAVYDLDHSTHPGGLAAVLVYGHAFGNSDYGMVMYEAGHDLNDDYWNGTTNRKDVPESAKVAAQRAYFNFVLITGIEKEITASAIIPDTLYSGIPANFSASANGGAPPYSFVWTSNNGGLFENQTDTDTTSSINYIPPCSVNQDLITLKVTDDCGAGRFSIISKQVFIVQKEAPTGDTIQTFCEGSTVNDLVANGNAIKWYDAATNGNLLETTTNLVDGQLYYASQTLDGCESPTRLAVRVILNFVYGGIIGNDQVACPYGSPDPLIEISPASGSGTLTYQWYSAGSETNTVPQEFNKIPFQSTSSSYNPPSLQAFYFFYKRITTSTLNGMACSDESNIITITADVEPPVWTSEVADITIECSDTIVAPTAVDNQDPDPYVYYSDVSTQTNDGSCSDYTYSIERSWYVKDNCDNESSITQVQNINVVDNTAPTASVPNLVVSCLHEVPTADIEVITDEADNCTAVPTVEFRGESSDGLICPLTITRIYRVSDDCGNYIDLTQTILVQDDIAPTASNPPNITVQCMADAAADIDIVTDESDNCTTNPLVEHYSDSLSGQTCPLTIYRTYRITDDCGNYFDVHQSILVEDTTPPEITCPADVVVSCGATADEIGYATATDNCDSNPNITSYDTIFEVDCDTLKYYKFERTWVATDTCGNESSCIQIVTVNLPPEGDTIAPTFTRPADITIYKDADCNYNNNPAVTGMVTEVWDNCSASTPIYNDSINDSNLCEIIILRTWSLVDVCGNAAADQLQTITVRDTTRPTFTAPQDTIVYKSADCTYDAGVAYTGDVTNEADNCGVGNATYTDSIDSTNLCSIIIERTWSLTDDCGNAAANQIQTIQILDTIPPTFTAPADTVVYKDADCNYSSGDVTNEADNCGVGEATYADSIDSTNLCSIIIERTWSLVDNCNNAAADQIQMITIKDTTAPTFTAPNDTVVFKNENCTYDASIAITGDVFDEADNCGVGEAVFEDIVDSTNLCAIVIHRKWNLSDNCNNAALEQEQRIIIRDTISPIIIGNTKDTIVACLSDVPNPNDITATDNCGEVVFSFTDSVADSSCINNQTITRIFTAEDQCGNTKSINQIITVKDTIAPVFTAPSDITIYKDENCLYNSDIEFTGEVTDESDNCSMNNATYEDVIDSTNQCNIIIQRTWSLSDDCGNAAENQVQIITVQDSTAPTFTVPADLVIYKDSDCNYSADTTFTGDVKDENDNCGVGEAIYTDFVDSTNLCQIIIHRTWSLTDNCGNSTNKIQLITITDTIPPTFTAPPDTTVYKDAECQFESGDVIDENDNCGVGEALYTDVIDESNPCSITIERTWSLEDDCGNAANNQIQIITIKDTVPPVFTGSVRDTLVDCFSNIPSPNEVSAHDNCTNTSISYVDFISDSSCINQFVITRVYTAKDECDNSSTLNQIITVKDTIAPTATIPAPISVECIKDIPAPNIADVQAVFDNCTDTPVVEFVSDSLDSLEVTRTIYRHYSITDACENKTVLIQNVFIHGLPHPVDDYDTINQNSENNIFLVLENDDFGCDGSGDKSIEILLSPSEGTVIINDNNSPFNNEDDFLVYTPFWNSLSDDIIEYTITDKDGDSESARVYIHFIPIPDLSIPEGFSPNEDGINDVFYIQGLQLYPTNSIVIFDQEGNTVFETDAYQNNWDGKNMFSNELLPQATYYYILDLGNGLKKMKGFVYLIRNYK